MTSPVASFRPYEQVMHPERKSFLLAAALSVALAAPGLAQDATPPAAAPATPEAAPAAPEATPAAPAAPSAEAPAAAAPAPAAPAEPPVKITKQGDWEVGCIEGTPSCEMQQVALDAGGNPVVLVRVMKLPAGGDALGLAVFNTPLGTLLPNGLGFQIDAGQVARLPFDWCVQEGCVVRLGLRNEEISALKRGGKLSLGVTSIAEPAKPVALTLSLKGFTAAFDSLPVPVPPPGALPAPAPAAPAPAPSLAPAAPAIPSLVAPNN